jgi:Ca-activated chloride channel family protein
MLVDNLRPEDKVAIVTYAGHAGVLLTPTSAKDKTTIKSAINSLGAGGSTAGAQGIITAYDLARANFIKNGNNRVIISTDGDFNVGLSSNEELEKLIEKKRKTGIYLSVCAFGTGNYQDDKMQILADKGNGNHSYIDNIHEARKVFVDEFGGTLFTVANDVKIQIEFNPASVLAYRLVGYENRMLAKEDFNDDTKDAGELGQGHSVTALYEIVPTGKGIGIPGSVDDLKYQTTESKDRPKSNKGELAVLKYRYKLPGEKKSKKFEQVVENKLKSITGVNEDIGFSVAVANFGLHLRASDYLKDGSLDECISLAARNKGNDHSGYRSEFIKLANTAKALGLE